MGRKPSFLVSTNIALAVSAWQSSNVVWSSHIRRDRGRDRIFGSEQHVYIAVYGGVLDRHQTSTQRLHRKRRTHNTHYRVRSGRGLSTTSVATTTTTITTGSGTHTSPRERECVVSVHPCSPVSCSLAASCPPTPLTHLNVDGPVPLASVVRHGLARVPLDDVFEL